MNIFARAALQAAVGVLGDERAVVQLNGEDGSVLGASRSALLVIGPMGGEWLRTTERLLPWEQFSGSVVWDGKTAERVLKSVARDGQFNGMLECFAIEHSAGVGRVRVTTTDGRGRAAIDVGELGARRAVEGWRETLRGAFAGWGDAEEEQGAGIDRMVFNRRRLLLVLQAIDRAFTDTAEGYAPVWVRAVGGGALLIRAQCGRTGLTAAGVISRYEWADEKELGLTDWERGFLSRGVLAGKRRPLLRRPGV